MRGGGLRECPICTVQFRKGRTVLVVGAGAPTRRVVCQGCARRAELVLSAPDPAVSACEVCASNKARVCWGCAPKARDRENDRVGPLG